MEVISVARAWTNTAAFQERWNWIDTVLKFYFDVTQGLQRSVNWTYQEDNQTDALIVVRQPLQDTFRSIHQYLDTKCATYCMKVIRKTLNVLDLPLTQMLSVDHENILNYHVAVQKHYNRKAFTTAKVEPSFQTALIHHFLRIKSLFN